MQHAPHGEPGRNTAVRRHAAAERSTVTQFSILGAIARLGEANLRQLEHTLAIDQTTLTRSLKLLERNGAIDRVPHPDGRIKAMRSEERRVGKEWRCRGVAERWR